MSWTVRVASTAGEFEEAVGEYLLEDEALHNVSLGIIETLKYEPEAYEGDNLLAYVVDNSGNVGGVVIRTPPHPGLFSLMVDEAAAHALVDVLVDKYPELPGVNVMESSRSAVTARLQQDGFEASVRMRQRAFQATEIEPPTGVAGEGRLAVPPDLGDITEWTLAFNEEAVPGTDKDEKDSDVRERVRDQINKKRVFVWEVGHQIVSMAKYAGKSPHGVRIGYVYTPPEKREHGYASAVTAAASQWALEQGAAYCFLFTDLDNATTNKIYPEIGYEPVGDRTIYELSSAASQS